MIWLLHLLAFLFFIPGLFITVPLHMLLGACSKSNTSSANIPDNLKPSKYTRNKAGHLVRTNHG